MTSLLKTHGTSALAGKARPLAFCAVPDTGEVPVTISEKGKPVPFFPNSLPLPSDLRADLLDITDELWCPRPALSDAPVTPWIVNRCADADEYRNSLIWLDEAYGALVPIFNHPRAIARSRRDHSARALHGVAGLTVPRCARFLVRARSSFEQCFAENNFQFPVLVRPHAGQTGRGLIKIDGADDWDAALNTQWFGQPHFMTEFVDFATQDQLYLKARVLFVADRFFIRHIKAATSWNVHNNAPNSLRDFKDSEVAMIHTLKEHSAFSQLCAAIPARTGLDFCGMDIGIDLARNQFVLFECNAAMSVFFRGDGAVDPVRQARRDLLETPASTAYRGHLANPEAWAWRNSSLSPLDMSLTCRDLLAD